jgi:hypothetical protein
MRKLFVATLFVLAACGPNKGNGGPDAMGTTGPDGTPDACVGLQCMEVNCAGQGIGTTRLSGTVFAPNGTLPLYGVNVYVPNADPGPIGAGLQCDRCGDQLPGSPVVKTTTDEMGHFNLDNVPVAPNIPVIVTVGKWRRQFTVQTVNMCQDNPVAATDTTLPKDASQGDMPNIAITTGNFDSLECLIRKLGVADKEITNGGGSGHVQLYAGNGSDRFQSGFAGGSGTMQTATSLWSSLTNLKKYDIVIFSCEGDWPSNVAVTDPNSTVSPGALQAVYDYANMGGRLFASHWHNYWLEFAPQPWPSIAQFKPNQGDGSPGSVTALVNENFDKGPHFAQWLLNVGASTVKDQLPITEAKNTCDSVTAGKADAWVTLNPATDGVQDLQFTTPNDQPADQRCGKVVFSDMHVSGSGHSDPGGTGYPSQCDTGPLSPQEKALAFIFFDIASCVGPVVN